MKIAESFSPGSCVEIRVNAIKQKNGFRYRCRRKREETGMISRRGLAGWTRWISITVLLIFSLGFSAREGSVIKVFGVALHDHLNFITRDASAWSSLVISYLAHRQLCRNLQRLGITYGLPSGVLITPCLLLTSTKRINLPNLGFFFFFPSLECVSWDQGYRFLNKSCEQGWKFKISWW